MQLWKMKVRHNMIISPSTSGPLNLLLRVLRQWLGGHWSHNNEEEEMAVSEWFQMQKSNFCHIRILKLVPKWVKDITVQINEIHCPTQHWCHITLCYMFRFARTIIRHFFLQLFKNEGTFQNAIILLVRCYYIWLFIKIINKHHIYGLKHPNYDVNKTMWIFPGSIFTFFFCFL